MRIAFDLDDTLIPGQVPFPLEPEPQGFLIWFVQIERLRLGTPRLINLLWNSGQEVWIYTTSFRSVINTGMMFRAYRTKVGTVINTDIHRRKSKFLGNDYKSCNKYPPMFGIDLLIDNCSGVKIESQRFCFEMLQIDPADDQWNARIRRYLGI